MKLNLAFLAIFAPSLAFAQSAPQQTSDPLQDVQQDYQTLAGAVATLPGTSSHLLDDLRKVAQKMNELQTENARLKAEAAKTAPQPTPGAAKP